MLYSEHEILKPRKSFKIFVFIMAHILIFMSYLSFYEFFTQSYVIDFVRTLLYFTSGLLLLKLLDLFEAATLLIKKD